MSTTGGIRFQGVIEILLIYFLSLGAFNHYTNTEDWGIGSVLVLGIALYFTINIYMNNRWLK